MFYPGKKKKVYSGLEVCDDAHLVEMMYVRGSARLYYNEKNEKLLLWHFKKKTTKILSFQWLPMKLGRW